MRSLLVIALIIVIGIVGTQLYKLYGQYASLRDTVAKINSEIDSTSKENLNLQADLNYFSDQRNLEKELRSRFNFKNPDEKLIIIIPPKQ